MISRVFCLWIMFFLGSLISSNVSEARHHRPSAVVVGTVYCDTCFHQDFSKASHFISGASVAVECGEWSKGRPSFREEVKTNDRGEFRAHLPFSVAKGVKKIRGCSVKLISSGEPDCAVASTAATSSIHLKERKGGTHVFSAGFFTFRPVKQPQLCNQKPSIQNSEKTDSPTTNPNGPTFLPLIQDPPASNPQQIPTLPPIPGIPGVPQLPGQLPVPPIQDPPASNPPLIPILPPIPGIPGVPPIGPGNPLIPPAAPRKAKEELVEPSIFPPFGILPPNPLLPPPSLLPPNPLLPPPSIIPPIIPSPPPSIFPPLFPSPPPSIFPPILPSPPSPPPSIFPPLFPSPPSPPSSIFPPFPRPIFPPIPGLTPSPPPPPPPSLVFPFPLPPFPFQPSPGSPPPAVTSSTAQKNP